ncbi:MAG TPA: type 4a pilus biogenesis protein PilO [Trueperaceae bacterium]|nr:type 4a pilus biogenesis protein PilO [Trueperaceae bacterium]
MNLGNFSFRNLRQRDVAILAIVLTLIVALLWYLYMYRPTQQRITTLQSDIQTLQTQILRGERAKANLPDLRSAVAQLEQDRRDFLAQLPKESDISGLIDQLRTSASASGVIVNSFSQGGGQGAVQDVRPIGFNVATTGNFTQTMDFLGKLEALKRFTKIHQVGLNAKGNASSDPDLNATFAFTVYVYTGKDPGAVASK